MNSLRKIFFALCLTSLPLFASAATSPLIISVSYVTPTIPFHIGSQINIRATAGNVTQIVALTVTASTTTSLNLYGAGLISGTTYYISDGYHVWKNVPNGSGVIPVNDTPAILISGPPVGTATTDYTSLASQTFNGYVTSTGNLLTSAQAPTIEVEIGAVNRVTLTDSGAGIWAGTYNVPVLGTDPADYLTSVKLVGHMVYLGSQAANDPFVSPQLIDSIDAQLPQVKNISISSMRNDITYSGLVYIAKSSMGNQTPNPQNTTAILDVQTNKQNCKIRLKADTTPALLLTQVPLGNSTEHPLYWAGTDGNGNFVLDNQYTMEVIIEDQYGVPGVTATAKVIVTSLIMEIKNPSVQPPSIPANYPSTALSNISYEVYLHNDTMDFQGNPTGMPGSSSIRNSLLNLGWGANSTAATKGFNHIFDYKSTIFSLMEVQVLNSDATETVFADLIDKDKDALTDDDRYFLPYFRGDPRIGKAPYCRNYFPFVAWPVVEGVAGSAGGGPDYGELVAIGDCALGNDWNTAFNPECQLSPTAGTLMDPIIMKADWAIQWQSSSVPPQGTYRVAMRGVLTGPEVQSLVLVDGCAGSPDSCTTTAGFWGGTSRFHVYPSAKPELGLSSDFRGGGLYAQDKSLLFTVTAPTSAIPDTTAPVILGTDPVARTVVLPAIYGPTRPIVVTVQDPESPIDTVQSNLSLTRSLGGTTFTISGVYSSDGGTTNHDATLYFYPNGSLVNGGTYTLSIQLCNKGTLGSGKCTSSNITFDIEDRSTPSLFSVTAIDNSNVTWPVYPGIQTQALGSLSQISVVLTMPTSNGTTNIMSSGGSSLTLTRTDTNTVVPITLLAKQLSSDFTSLIMDYKLNAVFFGSANFRVDITAVSQSSTDASKTYQATSLPAPIFFTSNSNNVVNICQGGPCGGTSNVVTTLVKPITITASVGSATALATYITPSASTITGLALSASSLTLPSGFAALPSTPPLQLGVGSTPLFNTNFVANTPVNITVFYDSSNIPSGVTPTSISVKAFTRRLLVNPWQDLIPVSPSPPVLGTNSFTFTYVPGPLGITIPDVFVIGYPSSAAAVANTSGLIASPTPVKSTRSFNPLSPDPLHNQAKIYYSSGPTAISLEAKVYNVAGALVRTLKPTNLTLADPGTSNYYFVWDGSNDGAGMVRNGIYLIRFEAKMSDGTTAIDTKMVALVK